MNKKNYAKEAAELAAVIKELSGKPKNLANLETYLTGCFAVWRKESSRTPEDIVEYLQMFASMEFEED